MIFEQCDSESNHIQYTALLPVSLLGDFNRLKIEAVLPSSIRESKTEAQQKRPVKKLRPQVLF